MAFENDYPDFVREAEAAMAAGETFEPLPGTEISGDAFSGAPFPDEENLAAEVTIKFGRGLVGDPFTAKSGKELVEVKIPNTEPGDSRPWESFVISPKMIHDNQYGKGVWMKLPENGETRLSRSVLHGQDEKGRNIWRRESRIVSNTELKRMLEAYKTRNSVLGNLSEKKAAAENAPRKAARDNSKKAAAPVRWR